MIKKGFTLAEVLITLGVIGIVAAMTIPGLITTYKAHQLRAQFLKSYSVVQQVFKHMEADDVSLNPQDYKSQDGYLFYQTFKNYLTGVLDCGNYYNWKSTSASCYDFRNSSAGYGYKTYNGKTQVSSSWFDAGQLLLQDGTLLLFENQSNANIWVHVDINGFNKKPNRWGYDLFTFHFTDGVLRTMGDKNTSYTNMTIYCDTKSSNSFNGIACAQKAKENADYFKKLVREFK